MISSLHAALRRLRSKRPNPAERGFSLVDLAIYIGVVSVIAGSITPNVNDLSDKAATSQCMDNLKQIATAMELYRSDAHFYPNGSGGYGVTGASFQATPTALTYNGTTYLSTEPRDPAAPGGATGAAAGYSVSVSGGDGTTPSFQISCSGQHASKTLAGLTKSGTTSACGSGCTAFQIIYASTAGFFVQ